MHVAFISCLELRNVNEALKDKYCLLAMQDELIQFERNEVLELVPKPEGHSIIGTKWIFDSGLLGVVKNAHLTNKTCQLYYRVK